MQIERDVLIQLAQEGLKARIETYQKKCDRANRIINNKINGFDEKCTKSIEEVSTIRDKYSHLIETNYRLYKSLDDVGIFEDLELIITE